MLCFFSRQWWHQHLFWGAAKQLEMFAKRSKFAFCDEIVRFGLILTHLDFFWGGVGKRSLGKRLFRGATTLSRSNHKVVVRPRAYKAINYLLMVHVY